MSEDAEKRFKKAMDKLFHSPRPKLRPSPPAGGMQLSKGKKAAKPFSIAKSDQGSGEYSIKEDALSRSLIPSRLQGPLCRPWDRRDLLRRLATFKSMTWFAKPKVVSSIKCASRGWVNVDMDTISCEACGARLLFSTYSSWSQQQVEKAAAVFSLKLDSGHKLLCPWIDNACDETLALFPPTPGCTLVENYNERSSALSCLSALPMVLPSATDYMWGRELQWLLEVSPPLPCSISGDIQPIDSSRSEESEEEAAAATLYYQAKKLISLCGWEPRSLPYVVDHKEWVTQFKKDTDTGESPIKIINELKPTIISSFSGSKDSETSQNNLDFLDGKSDPASIVLDCRLCGASVGLWAFTTIRQPLELIRLVKSLENNHQVASSSMNDGLDAEQSNGNIGKIETPSGSNLSIAGGLPPTEQNPTAKVSLPIISRNLRSGVYTSVPTGILKCNRSDNRLPNLECEGIGRTTNGEVNIEKGHLYIFDNQGESQMSKKAMPEDAAGTGELIGSEDSAVTKLDSATSLERGSLDGLGGQLNKGVVGNETVSDVSSSLDFGIAHEKAHDDQPPMASYAGEIHSMEKEGNKKLQKENSEIARCSNEEVDKSFKEARPVKSLKLWGNDKAMHFDPIKQHRHFCPWIASPDNVHLPGLQLTLSALHQESSSHASHKVAKSDSSILKVDDPIGSVRKLLSSPAEKKRKLNHESG